MGAIFNTSGTLTIIDLLSSTFTENFSATATNAALISDLANTANISSWHFANAYGLVATGPGSGSVNLHWKVWLDYFDGHQGDQVRAAMAAALSGYNKYEAIEFFAYQDDASFVPSVSDHLNNTGKYSLIVTVKTPTYDQLNQLP